MEKRKYQRRVEEFYDMSVDQIKSLIKDLNKIIKEAEEKLALLLKEATPNTYLINLAKSERTEANNKRVRAYSRLRKLGHSSKAVREQNATEKAEVIAQVNQNPQNSS